MACYPFLHTSLRWSLRTSRHVAGALLLLLSVAAQGAQPRSSVSLYPIPAEVRSDHFRVAVNGQQTEVLHAATGYYLLNFDAVGAVTVAVTAQDPHYWDRGVEVQPMRLGIRPVRHGATVTFPMSAPGKVTVTRPGDHFADAEMLFLFANPPDQARITAQTPHVRYYGPGVYYENLDARSGDTIYIAGGAVIFGSLNVWQVEDVRVLGTGTLIYDGPQDPHADQGWMHRQNWHAVVMDQARNIEVRGPTFITRSRSWQIQMKDSHHIGFSNVKVIGGNPNDANQDGMDWLGGGDTTVRNSFLRASDDVFALQGNWDGYDPELLRIPGHDVRNITIEDTIASTSISNTVRVGWPEKTFNSAHFRMSDVDVIHTGFGGCKVPFAFFELWADPDGKGSHSDYRFHDIRLEDWYSLYQVRQPLPAVRDVQFSEIWAMDSAAMVGPVLLGDVAGVTQTEATGQGFAGSAGARLEAGAAAPVVTSGTAGARFHYTAGLLKPRQKILFTAEPVVSSAADPEASYEWLFGDGTRAEGRVVTHAFPDAEGTLLDGSGRFRVLLHTLDGGGRQAWASRQVVLATTARARPVLTSEAEPAGGRIFERTLRIPAAGGYTFTLLTSTEASLSLDAGAEVHTPKARAQVCGAPGNAVQPLRLSAALTSGEHRIRVVRKDDLENADPQPEQQPELLWEGPGIEREIIPPGAYAVAP